MSGIRERLAALWTATRSLLSWQRQRPPADEQSMHEGAAAAELAPMPPKPSEPRKTHTPEQIAARAERRKLYVLRQEIADRTNATLDTIKRLTPLGSDPAGRRDYAQVVSELSTCDFFFLEFADRMPGASEWGAFNPDGDEKELAEIVWPIDFAAVLHPEGESYFFHIKTVGPETVRGRVRLVPRKLVQLNELRLTENEWWAETIYLGLVGDRWVCLDEGMKRSRMTTGRNGPVSAGSRRHLDDQLRYELNRTTSMAFSLALTERYSWHVALGFESGPRLLIPTSPRACLDLFKNRKKGDTERRREALRHWVHSFYRDTETAGLTYVRDHLRGATDFEWYDLDCELLVSEFDLEKNELFKMEAEQWRRQRKHNRVKVHLKRNRDNLRRD